MGTDTVKMGEQLRKDLRKALRASTLSIPDAARFILWEWEDTDDEAALKCFIERFKKHMNLPCITKGRANTFERYWHTLSRNPAFKAQGQILPTSICDDRVDPQARKALANISKGIDGQLYAQAIPDEEEEF